MQNIEQKNQEIMNFLHERVFDPILNSSTCPDNLKRGVRCTIMRMNKLDPTGKIKYFWSAIIGTDRSILFADQLRMANVTRFEDVSEEFRVRFDDNWLRN